MATWAPPSDVDLGVGKPLTQSKGRAIRDLSTALAERATGAPWLNAAGANAFFPVRLQEWPFTIFYDDTWTVPDNVFHAFVILVGGGGAGAGVTSPAVGGGGGSGAILMAKIEVEPAQVYTVKVGKGATGVVGGGTQKDGEDTQFGDLYAGGGKGGLLTVGGAGGGTVFGQVPTIAGTPGGNGVDTGSLKISGAGGGTMFHPGGEPVDDVGFLGAGNNGRVGGYGAGGSGASRSGGSDGGGGRGGDGLVLVRY